MCEVKVKQPIFDRKTNFPSISTDKKSSYFNSKSSYSKANFFLVLESYAISSNSGMHCCFFSKGEAPKPDRTGESIDFILNKYFRLDVFYKFWGR